MDEDGVIRVGGQASCYPPFRPLDISFDNSTLPSDRTRWSGNCSGKDHNEVLDPKGAWFSKSVKFHCMLYQESEAKTESQLMMDLPKKPPGTVHTVILLHSMWLLWSQQSEDKPKTNC